MATVDSNGIVRIQETDNVSPLHPVINSVAQSVSDSLDSITRIWPVANVTARTAVFNSRTPTAAKPLFVWRADAPAGRNLEYNLTNSNATVNWQFYESDKDATKSKIWRVANVTGRDAIFSAVGGGSSASPVFVWRADAPVGQQFEYNYSSTNTAANWHQLLTSQEITSSGSLAVSGSGLSGVVRWNVNKNIVSVRMDVSGAVSGDTHIATLPAICRGVDDTAFLVFSEYHYGLSTSVSYNNTYMNPSNLNIRIPQQTIVTRRVSSLVYDKSM